MKRQIIEIDEDLCNGCGQCVPSCKEGAIQIINGKARLVSEKYCDGLGACLGDCPTGALKVVEREAEEFDEAAAMDHVRRQSSGGCPGSRVQELPHSHAPAGGCPGARMHEFHGAAAHAASGPVASALTHWPVQIRLVPPTAPFLKGADLVVVADCVPAAYPKLHQDFMDGRKIMLGCPKFDDAELYIQRFADIFAEAGIKSVTVVVMQVPCCQGLPKIVLAGMAQAGVEVPMERVVISLEGQLLSREMLVEAPAGAPMA